MSEKINLEVNADFIDKFFALGDSRVPETIEQENLDSVLEIIKGKLEAAISLKNAVPAATPASKTAPKNPNNVIIVDDLGIVTVQLESVLKKMGFEVTVSNELFDAINKFKTQDFGYAVTDLFIPTEREGFILIDEIKKLSLLCKLNTRIIVMSASNKKEHKEKCLNRGADYFVEKAQGWQKKIAEICTGQEEEKEEV